MEEKGRVSVSCGVEKERDRVCLGFTLHFFSTLFLLCVSGQEGPEESPRWPGRVHAAGSCKARLDGTWDSGRCPCMWGLDDVERSLATQNCSGILWFSVGQQWPPALS